MRVWNWVYIAEGVWCYYFGNLAYVASVWCDLRSWFTQLYDYGLIYKLGLCNSRGMMWFGNWFMQLMEYDVIQELGLCIVVVWDL